MSERWLAYRRPNPNAAIRLFCFPYSGAGASIFRDWARDLPPSVEVCPVQLPGRENRLGERPFTSMPALIRATIPALLPHLHKPFALFGHSMGALLAFELARALRREAGVTPVHLFVSGHGAPQLPRSKEPLHALPDEAFVAHLQALKGAPAAVWTHPELRELLLPILRADFALCETYQYRDDDPLPCAISALGGLADDHVSVNDLAAWQAQCAARFTRRMFPGDHFYLQRRRPLLLQTVARDLAQRPLPQPAFSFHESPAWATAPHGK